MPCLPSCEGRPCTEVQKGAQCTCQAEMLLGSSFTPSVASLVRRNGTMHTTVDCHKRDASKLTICSFISDVS